MTKKLPTMEYMVYAALNIIFFGWPWAIKIIIKKAIMEANND